MHMTPRLRFVLLLLVLGAIVLTPMQAIAQTKSLEWTRLDTDITVQPNGDLQIVETNVINFTGGTFTFGFREIDLSRLANVTNISAEEAGQPLEIETVETDDNKLRIKYYFARPASFEQRTFILRYTVSGAVRYYEGGDQVYWASVYADRNGFPVLNARTTVRLPNGAAATNAEVYGVDADVTGLSEGALVMTAKRPIDSGDQMEVRVQFPHGIVQGGPAAWQQAYDEQRAYDEQVKPRNDLLTLLASALVFFGGPALAAVLYVTRGRDPNVGLVAEYLNQPPDIPPGLAGALVDETADMQDVVATLVDLGRRGVLTMAEKPVQQMGGLMTVNDWVFSRGEKFGTESLRPYEQTLISSLGISDKREVALSSLRNKFFANVEKIKQGLYAELVSARYYNNAPPATRASYQSLAMLMGGLAVLAFCGSTVFSALTNYAICLPIAFGVTAAAFFVIAKQMPARTRAGAEMKMRAEAFKRYLQNIEKYTDVKASKDQFEKYLPYAIAFGLERTWTQKFAAVDTPMPPWYVPTFPRPYYDPFYGKPAGGYRTGPFVGGAGGDEVLGRLEGRGDISDAARQGGGIEGMEKGMARGVGSIEGGLSSMFDSIGTVFSSTPAPRSSRASSGGWSSGRSGGGWSGGGGGGGGSSGGGGGGFG